MMSPTHFWHLSVGSCPVGELRTQRRNAPSQLKKRSLADPLSPSEPSLAAAAEAEAETAAALSQLLEGILWTDFGSLELGMYVSRHPG